MDVTARQVTDWLKKNPTVKQGRASSRPTTLTDGYKATGYKGPPLKVKAGNLTNKRGDLRLAKRGENGDHKRSKNLKLRQPQTPQERTANRKQEKRRAELNKRDGKGSWVIDHRIPLDRLGETVEGKSPEEAQRTIENLEKVYGPVGDRNGNREVITATDNEEKRQQEKAVQRRLGEMEEKRPSSPESLAKFSSPSVRYAMEAAGKVGTVAAGVGRFALGAANVVGAALGMPQF
jgi:5-methylcytosine-specific restriction endonuclease McrA